MNRPRLSIIVLTYNRELMLADCLDSVTAVQIPDCEILLYDDASTDCTPEVCARYERTDKRLRSFRHPHNVGVFKNCEAALESAKGRYLAVIADDDSVLPGNFERKLAVLDSHPEVGLIYSLFYATDEHNQRIGMPLRSEYMPYSYVGDRNEFADLMSGNYIPGPSVVLRRDLWERLGGHDPTMPATLSDWDLWMRYSYHMATAFIREPLVNVRYHGAGMSAEQMSQMAMGMIPVWRKWLVEKADPPVLDARVWERMRATFASEVNRCCVNDQSAAVACMQAFKDLQRDALANASRHFAVLSRSLPDGHSPQSKMLVLAGPCHDQGSHGDDLRSLANVSLADVGIRVEDVHWTAEQLLNPSDDDAALLETQWVSLQGAERVVRLWNAPPPFLNGKDDGPFTLGRPLWGGRELPAEWARSLEQLQGVLVPNRATWQAALEAGIVEDKLALLPTCIDTARFMPDGPREDLQSGRSFNFVSILDWSLECGWDVLIRAFVNAFQASDDVALNVFVRSSRGRTKEQIQADVFDLLGLSGGQHRALPLIRLTVGVLQHQLSAINRAGQAYANLSRVEATGRRTFEALATGLPVISSACGALVEFLNERNAFPVGCHRGAATEDGWSDAVWRDSEWDEPDLEQAQAMMRQIVEQYPSALERARHGRDEIASRFSPQAVGAILAKVTRLA